jgi:4-amino-4-deoxy-L-arabinose transferase-like glycosyltransferase
MAEKPSRQISNTVLLSVIFIVSLVLYSSIIVFLGNTPFIYDEGFYALMIQTFSGHPSVIIPTLAGESVGWKPPLFIWVYSGFFWLLNSIPFPIETIHRLPSAVFGALSIVLIYLISEKLYGKPAGIISAAILLLSPLMIFASSLVMMESFSVFLVLAAIYFYLDNKILYGSVFLAMIVLTKWLYVTVPIFFIGLYFLKTNSRNKIFASFLSIPLAFAFYFLLSAIFGNLDNAISNTLLDLSRPVPSFNLLILALNILYLVLFSFPLPVIFLVFSLANWDDFTYLYLIVPGMIGLVLPFSQYFLPWYEITIIPIFVLYTTKILMELNHPVLISLILSSLLLCSFVVDTFYLGPLLLKGGEDSGIRQLSLFMKDKKVFFFEPFQRFDNWGSINQQYRNTNKSYLLLEQLNPGFLYYRFNDSTDYQDVVPLFAEDGQFPVCGEGSYLVLQVKNLYLTKPALANASSIPACFKFISRFGDYYLYNSS